MNRLVLRHFLLIVLAVLCCAPRAATAQDDREQDAYQRAVEAMALRRYRYAIGEIDQFLRANIGDSREQAARKLAVDAHSKLIDRYTELGWTADAAYRQLGLARLGAGFGVEPDALRAAAVVAMTDAIRNAVTAGQHTKVMALYESWPRLFGSDSQPPVSADELDAARLGATLMTLSEAGMIEFLPDVVERYYPDKPAMEQISTGFGQDAPLAYARTLAERGWFGRYSAEVSRIDGKARVEADKRFAVLSDKVVLAAAEARLSHGNRAMIARFMRDHGGDVLLPVNVLAMQRHRNTAQPMIDQSGEARVLDFDRPVRGEGVWRDEGNGFQISDTLRMDHADITVAEGSLIEGGTIEMYSSTLRLRGSRKRPIIVRNVHIDVDTGSVEAENTIFIDCTFRRPGDRHEGLYASRWRFNQCMVYRSTFDRLDVGRYGVQFTQSIFVECDLPGRHLWGGDLARHYNGDWSDISNCLFYRCEIEMPFLWATSGCNFMLCAFDEHGRFQSTSNLQVKLYATEAERTAEQLQRETLPVSKGEATYSLAPRPARLSTPDEFWLLLPVDLRADQRAWPVAVTEH